VAVQEWLGLYHFRWQLCGLGLEEFVILHVPVTGGTIDPVKFEFFGKCVAGKDALEFGGPHFLDELKSHVLADAEHNLVDLLIGEAEATENCFRHFRADAIMVVEPDPVRRAHECGRLANVVQQHRKRQHRPVLWRAELLRGRIRHHLQHQSRMLEHITLGMKFGWLLDALHRGNFG